MPYAFPVRKERRAKGNRPCESQRTKDGLIDWRWLYEAMEVSGLGTELDAWLGYWRANFRALQGGCAKRGQLTLNQARLEQISELLNGSGPPAPSSLGNTHASGSLLGSISSQP
jgi:hypothetical protein